MFDFISFVFQNLTFFALHLKNINSFPKPLSAKKEKELSQTFANLERIWDEYDVYEKGIDGK